MEKRFCKNSVIKVILYDYEDIDYYSKLIKLQIK